MKGLEIGDRVEVLRNGNGIDAGTKGTIIEISGYIIGVEFDEYEGGHSCGGKGKKGHCRCINSEFLRKIEEKEVEKMSEFKIGDRVEVIGEPIDGKNLFGEMGKVVAFGIDFDALFDETDLIGVEFDNNILGHDCCGDGKDGHCWWVGRKYLEKIEDTEEETKEEVNKEAKAETMEQKILTALREEIGVEIGEEFDVYENGVKRWTCKFEEIGFFHKIDGEFHRSGVWKDIVYNFCRYTFKKKPFIPQEYENYWHVDIRYSGNLDESLDVRKSVWVGILFDYGNLALGNVFRTKEEAFENKDKLLERLNELLKGEWIWKSCCKS